MMNSLIEDLIISIKEDKLYQDFIDASNMIKKEPTYSLMKEYNEINNELNEIRKYDEYIDNQELEDKFKNIKTKLANDENISEYYHRYHNLNNYLYEITKILFDNISDELDFSGMNI